MHKVKAPSNLFEVLYTFNREQDSSTILINTIFCSLQHCVLSHQLSSVVIISVRCSSAAPFLHPTTTDCKLLYCGNICTFISHNTEVCCLMQSLQTLLPKFKDIDKDNYSHFLGCISASIVNKSFKLVVLEKWFSLQDDRAYFLKFLFLF